MVAGIRTPQPIGELAKRRWPDGLRSSCSERPRRSSRSTTATCRTSSSPSRTASSTCCRPAAASAPATPRVRIAVEMVERGADHQGGGGAAASSRESLDQLLHPIFDPRKAAAAKDGRLLARACRPPGRRVRRRSSSPPTTPSTWRSQGEKVILVRARDLARGHPRHERRRGHPHRARRHDLARGGGRAAWARSPSSAAARSSFDYHARTMTVRPRRAATGLKEGDWISLDGFDRRGASTASSRPRPSEIIQVLVEKTRAARTRRSTSASRS